MSFSCENLHLWRIISTFALFFRSLLNGRPISFLSVSFNLFYRIRSRFLVFKQSAAHWRFRSPQGRVTFYTFFHSVKTTSKKQKEKPMPPFPVVE